MNLNVLKKTIAIILLIALGIVLFGQNVCYAIIPNKNTYTNDGGGGKKQSTPSTTLDASKIYDDQDYYKPTSEPAPEKMKQIVGIILGAIKTIGIVLSVVCLMVIGIKFMLGSVEQKADYKKVMPGYILGVIMIAAMSLIPSIIYDLVSNW